MKNKYNYDNITADTYINEKSREVMKSSMSFIRSLTYVGCFLLLMIALICASVPFERSCDKNIFKNYFEDRYTYTIGDTVKVADIDEPITIIAYCYYGEDLIYVDNVITKPYDYIGVEETNMDSELQELIYFNEEEITQVLTKESVN